MSDYTKMQALGMAPLRTALRVRLMRLYSWTEALGSKKQLATRYSPFYFEMASDNLIIASKAEQNLALAQDELALAVQTAPQLRPGGEIKPVGLGVRVQLVLPEVIFTDLYESEDFGKKAPQYIAYRNAIYLRLASKLAAVSTQLVHMLGGAAAPVKQADLSSLKAYEDSNRDSPIGASLGRVTLMGNRMAERGILGLEIDVPMVTAQSRAALSLLRDTVWALLAADGAITDLQAYLRDFYADKLPTWLQDQQSVLAPPATPFKNLPGATRAFLAAAIAAGADVDVLDAKRGVLQIKRHKQAALVVGGTVRLNNAAAQELSTNRLARSVILAAAKIPVPQLMAYSDVETAMQDFAGLAHKSLVLKPQVTTASGQMRLYPQPVSADAYRAAITPLIADGGAITEMFVAGDALRLLVLKGKVLGVLAIDSASVVGDGRSSFSALLERRNAQRQTLPYAPLTLTAADEAALEQQGVSADTVIARGTQVYLERNSRNLACGEHMNGLGMLDKSYYPLAVQAAAALQLKYCTVDIVVRNSYAAYDASNPDQCSVVAVDAAPDLLEFANPTYGQAQEVVSPVINAILRTQKKK
ncbi:hypothetical protein [Lacticaseibacillus zhaodongensis]|uniref:hypothetical protein n=1 Tax=Lacticaseibacillus zhaodongensis TaxID=2668065 RepID=UPI0012D34BA2|nr:hypothetical protein [Lacticaseibacillus zhaodongensis]